MNKFIFLAASTCLASIASAQSVNIDFNYNGVGTVPTNSYAAAGSAGVWNSPNVATGTISNYALVDLSGAGTTALLNSAGFGGNWSNFGSWTGDDNSLMEDLLGSGSNFGQVTITGLQSGLYKVTLYGMASSGNVTTTFSINSVNQTTGGAWAGFHVLGGSYAQYSNVAVSNTLTIDWRGNFNGAQLEYSPVPEPMSIMALASGVALMLRKRRA